MEFGIVFMFIFRPKTGRKINRKLLLITQSYPRGRGSSLRRLPGNRWPRSYPRLQILCIEDLLKGDKVKMPPTASTFKKAERIKKASGEQGELNLNGDSEVE